MHPTQEMAVASSFILSCELFVKEISPYNTDSISGKQLVKGQKIIVIEPEIDIHEPTSLGPWNGPLYLSCNPLPPVSKTISSLKENGFHALEDESFIQLQRSSFRSVFDTFSFKKSEHYRAVFKRLIFDSVSGGFFTHLCSMEDIELYKGKLFETLSFISSDLNGVNLYHVIINLHKIGMNIVDIFTDWIRTEEKP